MIVARPMPAWRRDGLGTAHPDETGGFFLYGVGPLHVPPDGDSRCEARNRSTYRRDSTDKPYDEFESIIDSGDQTGAAEWLQDNAPDYRTTVATEMERVKAELAADAGAILERLRSEED